MFVFWSFLVLISNFVYYTARIHSAPKICTKRTLRPICRKRSRHSTPDSRLLMRKTRSLRRLYRRKGLKLSSYCRILDWSFRILRVLLRRPRNSVDNITFARTQSRWMRRRKPVQVCEHVAEIFFSIRFRMKSRHSIPCHQPFRLPPYPAPQRSPVGGPLT